MPRSRAYGNWIAVTVLAGIVHAQSPAPQGSAVVEGTLRDSQGRPAAAATVSLHAKTTDQTSTAQADAAGAYRFLKLPGGTYTIRAEAAGAGVATFGPFGLGEGETKQIDLTLEFAFSDEPDFIVAGVSDATNRGGHGSDVVPRSAETLAKAAADLSKESSGGAHSASGIKREADLLEKQGKPLEALREYQRAADLDASEPNLFDWGAELLTHRAPEPATTVFSKGHRLFPHSLRMLLGLAAAWYARGSYEQAARRFFEACDLDPSDPVPYMFLGRVQSLEIIQLAGYTERLARFAKLHPDNAWANYYYAAGLWKQRKEPDDSETPARVRFLLEKAIGLDPKLGAAYLLLGILYSGQSEGGKAIEAYEKAIAANPEMEEAHYRLGQAYGRIGEKDKARKELETYQELSRNSAAQAERERREIQQFVYELKGWEAGVSPR